MKYHFITYGCQMNTADAQEMAQPLLARGLVATADPQDADIIMMNTCTVREQAEHKADSNIGRLREWKAANPERILIVAGCAATRWGDSIQKKYPFIDLVSPATRIEQFPEAIATVFRERWNWDGETRGAFQGSVEGKRAEGLEGVQHTDNWFGDENTAYVTIMRGCNYTCSYCIVPQVRGREKYRAMPDIVNEIKQKAAQGQRHVMLLGQTVNSYHWRDTGTSNAMGAQPCASTIPMDFSDLLRAVNALDDVETIRFMSPHPRHMRPSVIAAMAESPKVRRHLHLPLQSGSTALLARMKRLYTRDEYADIVAQLRAAMPGLKITTDVIVGFPGETEDDFAQTVSLLEDIRFDGLFAFKYSPRPGTASAEWVDDVSAAVKDERLQKILAFSHVDLTA
jgi:tRNA-2-methylthio-N6-dimethylallyladenosine synthase